VQRGEGVTLADHTTPATPPLYSKHKEYRYNDSEPRTLVRASSSSLHNLISADCTLTGDAKHDGRKSSRLLPRAKHMAPDSEHAFSTNLHRLTTAVGLMHSCYSHEKTETPNRVARQWLVTRFQ
jgi:hypothetical protein